MRFLGGVFSLIPLFTDLCGEYQIAFGLVEVGAVLPPPSCSSGVGSVEYGECRKRLDRIPDLKPIEAQ
jgi:hypothetical protein